MFWDCFEHLEVQAHQFQLRKKATRLFKPLNFQKQEGRLMNHVN